MMYDVRNADTNVLFIFQLDLFTLLPLRTTESIPHPPAASLLTGSLLIRALIHLHTVLFDFYPNKEVATFFYEGRRE